MYKEIWLDIKGFPDYKISDRGRVRSLKHGRSRILRPVRNPRNYLYVTLYRGRYDIGYLMTQVSWLVLEAFVGERPRGYVTNHKDGDTLNNRLENLEWVTPSYNTKHAFDIGLRPYPIRMGEKTPNAKLKESAVLLIKKMLYHGIYRKNRIAEEFGVSPRCIQHIDKGSSWSHVRYP